MQKMKIIENKNIEKNKVELTVNVGAEEFEAALEKAYRKNVKTINVPGFRKGKAPRKMVEKMYGEGVFFEDAINDLYPNALADAIEEAKLDVVARPEVEISEVKKEDGFTFKALCVVRPEVKVSNYKGINAKKEVKAVTDEDVDNRIKAMRERNSRLVDISDRASKNGDTLIFNFDGYVDGKAFDGGKAENFSLEIGSNQFIPGFEPQLENRNIGEDFDVTVTFPEEYHAEELKGKEAIFKCKINEIKEKQMPALDDEFAKDVSEFDTLEELKADVKKKIEEANEKEADNKLEGDLIDEVIKNLEGDIPQEMYETRIDEMLRDFEYR
ncbi:MAG: trigger factor, partial [Oscillospiraceae bacterium]